MMSELIEYAKSFIGTSYLYGGTSPIMGWDCSEYALELLRSVGIGPKTDATAKMLHAHMVMNGELCLPQAGAFVFYGKDTDSINHIDFMISENQVIGMRGGDSSTTNLNRANLQRAYCKIRPYGDRKDVLDVLMPQYPQWVR